MLPLLQLQLVLLMLQGLQEASGQVPCKRFDNCTHPYVVVLDASSITETGVYVYRFDRNNSLDARKKMKALSEKRTARTPGIASFANFPQRIRAHLQPLIRFAMAEVPAESHEGTAIALAATADAVRDLTRDQGRAILRAAAAALRATPFSVHNKTISDQALAMILSGREVAVLAWVGLNFVMHRFESRDHADKLMFGVLQLGDVSAQIATKSADIRYADPSRTYTVEHGYWTDPISYPLHLNSYPGLGKSVATLAMLGYYKADGGPPLPVYTSPCLHPVVKNRTHSFGKVSINVSGDPGTNKTNRWARCLARARSYLEEKAPIHEAPNKGTYVYMAIGEFFNVFHSLIEAQYLANSNASPILISFLNLTSAAKLACQQPPEAGKMQDFLCLDAAYIVALLNDGFQLADGHGTLHSLKFYTAPTTSDFSTRVAITPGWQLGLAATYVKEPCYIGTPGTGNF